MSPDTFLPDDVSRGNPWVEFGFVKVDSLPRRKADSADVRTVLEPVMPSKVLIRLKTKITCFACFACFMFHVLHVSCCNSCFA